MFKKLTLLVIACSGILLCGGAACVNGDGHGDGHAEGNSNHLRVILIRHGEKPDGGDNLNCKGLNRSLALPGVLYPMIGRPDYTYVPSISPGRSTNHARMLETIAPFAIKYDLTISNKYDESEVGKLAKDILDKKGTVLVVWEHARLESIARALGVVDDTLTWSSDDYDGIWIITFSHGTPHLEKRREGLTPADACPF